MQALLVFLAIAALSMLASSRTVLDPGRFPALAQLSASGLLFLVFGALVGPGFMSLLTPADLEALRPVVALGLGLAGVIVGLHQDPRLLRLLPLWGGPGARMRYRREMKPSRLYAPAAAGVNELVARR